MSVRTVTLGDHTLTVQTLEKIDHLGEPYWQGRAMFRIAAARARVDVITSTRHISPESAESAAISLARSNGWGAS